MFDALPEHLKTRSRWGGPGIWLLTLGFVVASLAVSVPAPVWVTTAVGLLIAWAIWIDIETFRLPDALTLPLVGVATAYATLNGLDALTHAAIGAAGGYGVMRATGLYMDWRLGGRFMMLGDAKFMAGLGGLTGWEGVLGIFIVGSASGLAEGLLRFAGGRVRAESGQIPFGPHLALGFTTVWMTGPAQFLEKIRDTVFFAF